MKKKKRISIIGAAGYTGFELVKILTRHDGVEIIYLADREKTDDQFSDIFPALKGICDLPCSLVDKERICNESDVIFFALPHKISMQMIPDFCSFKGKIIDLSADYRLNNAALYKTTYGTDHLDTIRLDSFVYGLPELNRKKIQNTSTVANPGCFPTGIELALIPVLKQGLVKTNNIFVNSVTGVSGGGRNPKAEFHFPECNENITAYKVASHQHEPEIEQELSKVAGLPVDIVFVPHLAPLTRGILNTIYAELSKPISQKAIVQLYQDYYHKETFVRVLNSDKVPQIKNVAYSNFCDIGLKVHNNTVILMSAIDNLIKGASGQAVQNMNIMLGFDEKAGLL